jgi:hypothetical protein
VGCIQAGEKTPGLCTKPGLIYGKLRSAALYQPSSGMVGSYTAAPGENEYPEGKSVRNGD